jgi:phage terminase Nu1 subunit (DNA packaging protein)
MSKDTQTARAKKAGRSQPAQSKAERRARRQLDAQMAVNKRMDNAAPPPDLLESRARLTAAQAEKQEVENKARAGQLVERDDVHRANVEHGAQVRGRLLNLGNELGPLLANLDARQIKSELDRWAAELLTQWADWAEDRTDG